MRRSASALVGAAVLAGGLVFGAGSALAEEPLPVVGTAECADAVEDAGPVVQARQNLATAETALADAKRDLREAQGRLSEAQDALSDAQSSASDLQEQIAKLKAEVEVDGAKIADLELQLGGLGVDDKQSAFDDAQADVDSAQSPVSEAEDRVSTARTLLSQARVAATSTVCAPAATTTTTTTPPAAEDGDLREAIADLECDDTYAADRGRISDELIARAVEPGTGELFGLLADRDRALNFCLGTPAVSDVPLNPADDDDSVAEVSGSQVREVPEGSASTGAA